MKGETTPFGKLIKATYLLFDVFIALQSPGLFHNYYLDYELWSYFLDGIQVKDPNHVENHICYYWASVRIVGSIQA